MVRAIMKLHTEWLPVACCTKIKNFFLLLKPSITLFQVRGGLQHSGCSQFTWITGLHSHHFPHSCLLSRVTSSLSSLMGFFV